MSTPKTTYLEYGEIVVWAKRLAAEDWSRLTWKHLIGDAELLLLWAIFLITLVIAGWTFRYMTLLGLLFS